jgi:tRNA U34 5-methylaminomethyl-2-thiouridine-forming methyltransferase MnmC
MSSFHAGFRRRRVEEMKFTREDLADKIGIRRRRACRLIFVSQRSNLPC